MLLFFIAVTLFSSLQGMNNDWELYKELKKQNYHYFDKHPYDVNNIEKYKQVINFADKQKDGDVTAKLLRLCCPPEIEERIAQPLRELIATKYKHKLIKYKWSNDELKDDKFTDNSDLYYFSRHDGTYSMVPRACDSYKMWCDDKVRYVNDCVLLASFLGETNKSTHNVITINRGNEDQLNKKVIFSRPDKLHVFISPFPVSHCRLSCDGNLLAITNSGQTDITIVGDGENYHIPMSGKITALCSAHHSPLFAVGSSEGYTKNLGNLVIIKNNDYYFLDQHFPHSLMTCVEFSPDDKRLLSCSYGETSNESTICLWDTSNFNDIKLMHCDKVESRIKNAFFISDGKQIVVIKSNGLFDLFDGFTAKSIQKEARHTWDLSSEEHQASPIVIWSAKNNLLMTLYNYNLQIFSSHTGKFLGDHTYYGTHIIGAGLTRDESAIITLNGAQGVNKLSLYNEQDYKEIAWIEKETNIIYLYNMLEIGRLKDYGSKSFISIMRLYIQEHLKSSD